MSIGAASNGVLLTARRSATGRVDLAAEPPFRLGRLRVIPALRQVEGAGRPLTLEPRVMQVLVVLAGATSAVVSRDELVERCWDGRIVGENAIQRAISRIRQLAATTGGFELETIPRVGYRLLISGEAGRAPDNSWAAEAPVAPSIARRRLLGMAAIAAAALGGGLVAVKALGSDERDVRAARALVARAREAMLARLDEGDRQAIAYLKRATELDPDSAEAWGTLARVQQRQLEFRDGPELSAYAAWSRAYAERALAIDPRNVDAKAALVTIRPNFRHWAENEAAIRKVMAQHPDEASLESALGWLLCDTGRWREAIACFRKTLALEPFDSGHQLVMAWGLWGSGALPEAERVLNEAARLWPSHMLIWLTRLEFLASTGQPDAAIAMMDDPAARPVAPAGWTPPWDTYRAYAHAMKTRTSADVGAAVASIRLARERDDLSTWSAVTCYCSFGMADACFPLLERFYFGRDGRGLGALSRRKTSILFSANGRPLRQHPRYPELTRRLGLDDYWRSTGTRPDARI